MGASAFVMIVLVGLAVDLGGQVHAQQRVRDVAAQAARTGAQHVVAAPVVRGGPARVDPGAARAAATGYLAAAGVAGDARTTAAATLVVTTTATYQTRFLSLIGITALTVTGRAETALVRAVDGAPS